MKGSKAMDKSMRTESESSPKQPGTTTMAKAARRVFLGICWCNGILAVIFGSLMIASPSGELLGMQQLLVEMQSWPNAHIFFKDLVWPGIALILVNGVSNLIALAFWMARHRIHTILGLIAAIWPARRAARLDVLAAIASQ